MMAYRDFRWLQDAPDELKSIADSIAREADELNASGDEAAATAKIERSTSLDRKASDRRFEFLKAPGFDQWRTLCVAAGLDFTGETVDRMAAAAAVKRGLTLGDLRDLSAVEVAAMVADDIRAKGLSLDQPEQASNATADRIPFPQAEANPQTSTGSVKSGPNPNSTKYQLGIAFLSKRASNPPKNTEIAAELGVHPKTLNKGELRKLLAIRNSMREAAKQYDPPPKGQKTQFGDVDAWDDPDDDDDE